METYLCFRFAVDRNQELHHFRVEWQHCVQGSVNSNFFVENRGTAEQWLPAELMRPSVGEEVEL